MATLPGLAKYSSPSFSPQGRSLNRLRRFRAVRVSTGSLNCIARGNVQHQIFSERPARLLVDVADPHQGASLFINLQQGLAPRSDRASVMLLPAQPRTGE